MKKLRIPFPSRAFCRFSISIFVISTCVTTAFALPQVWTNPSAAGSFSNFSGKWNSTGDNWTAPAANPYSNPTSNGSPTTWQDDSTAFFGGNGETAADPDGSFTVAVDGIQRADGVRQIENGSGNYTIEGGTLKITGPNGVRTDRGVFTVNSPLSSDLGLIMYLCATDENSVLILGGANDELRSGSICLNGNPGIVKLANATALGIGWGSLELKSNSENNYADTLDINGLEIAQSRTLLNPSEGSGTARLVNNNTKEKATFADNIQLRASTKLAFGGSGAGLTLSGKIDGDGRLITAGNTTVALTQGNSYTGGTRIGSGSTLLLPNASESPAGTGEIQVEAGGVLASNEGEVTITNFVKTDAQTSGFAPGASPNAKSGAAGQLVFDGGLDLSNGVTIFFDLGSSASDSDLLKVATQKELRMPSKPGSIIFDFTKAKRLARSYVVLEFTGVETPRISTAVFSATGVKGSFRIIKSAVEFIPIP